MLNEDSNFLIVPEVRDEFAPLMAVVLGTAVSFGGIPKLEDVYDPKSKEHMLAGTFPVEPDLVEELEGFAAVLFKYNIVVHRPVVLENYNQIFSRDIGFVIDDKFIITNMLEDRSREVDAIQKVLQALPETSLLDMRRLCPDGKLEGGDIMPVRDFIFLGYSEDADFNHYTVARTNKIGVEFIRKNFPNRKLKTFELKKSDEDARDNALHLDCCFQSLGLGHCLLYPAGFKNQEDVLFIEEFFGKENVIEIDREEMYHMGSNIFSLCPDVVVSERGFTRINQVLRKLGYTVEEVKYSEVAKMEGLLRCSTLPLVRKYTT